MADDVGVDGVAAVARPGRARFAQRLADRGRADPAVAVPERLAVLEPQPVHHAVADEPVVAGGGRRADRVGADAQVAPSSEDGMVPVMARFVQRDSRSIGAFSPVRKGLGTAGLAMRLRLKFASS